MFRRMGENVQKMSSGAAQCGHDRADVGEDDDDGLLARAARRETGS